jgi:hypothetical protein
MNHALHELSILFDNVIWLHVIMHGSGALDCILGTVISPWMRLGCYNVQVKASRKKINVKEVHSISQESDT